jgi:tetratricopeptide (TPR) repeat protein
MRKTTDQGCLLIPFRAIRRYLMGSGVDRPMGSWAYGLVSLSYLLCIVSVVSGSGDGDIDYYSPENILKFADHLYQERDYLRAAGEYQRYLFCSFGNADSILYKLGLCYRRSGDLDKAITFFRRVADNNTDHHTKFAVSYQIAYSHFLSQQYEGSIQILNETLAETEDTDERGRLQILSAFNYLHQRRWHDAERTLDGLRLKDAEQIRIASSLRESAREGMELQYKSPLLAGLLSAIVPGAGKLYCKQYGDGFYSLFLAGVAGLLAWDGFRENGVRSIKGWAFASVGGIFYTGNVYGSAIAARVHNYQLETDLLIALPPVPDD